MNSERSDTATAISPTATIVIVGAGQAGGWAAQTLRNEGFTGRLVLIGDETHPPHERPPLSKAVLAGEAAPAGTWLLKPEAFAALGLEWWLDTRVTRIDRAAKRLEIANGEMLSYDKLILCTGGRARALNLPGTDTGAVHTLRTIGDALALAPQLRPERSIVVIGGGWIGLEVAATARQKAPRSPSSKPRAGYASAPCRRKCRSTCSGCMPRMAPVSCSAPTSPASPPAPAAGPS